MSTVAKLDVPQHTVLYQVTYQLPHVVYIRAANLAEVERIAKHAVEVNPNMKLMSIKSPECLEAEALAVTHGQ